MEVKNLNRKDRYVRKVNQTGNSLSVGIPKNLSEKLNLQKGDFLELDFNEETNSIVVKKMVDPSEMEINPRLLKSMDIVMDKYKGMFENLKDR